MSEKSIIFSNSLMKLLLCDQRLKALNMILGIPKYISKSYHGMPVRILYNIPSTVFLEFAWL